MMMQRTANENAAYPRSISHENAAYSRSISHENAAYSRSVSLALFVIL